MGLLGYRMGLLGCYRGGLEGGIEVGVGGSIAWGYWGVAGVIGVLQRRM